MRTRQYRWNIGVTLIEMLLVTVVISMIVFAYGQYIQERIKAGRNDRVVLQMQQILNAAMSYYIANGSWPANMAALTGTYLPAGTMTNPWGQSYNISVTAAVASPAKPSMFYVSTQIIGTGIQTFGIANAIAGYLPNSYLTKVAGTATTQPSTAAADACSTAVANCYVVASVNIPGQTLNTATAVNFGGIYTHGGCVPVPICPTGMTPKVLVAPSSVSGLFDNSATGSYYPISSFTAYAVGGTTTSPPACTGSATAPACTDESGTLATAYWRVCLQIVTPRGDIQVSNKTTWGSQVKLMAVTRCALTGEVSGSGFTISTD